MTDQPTDPFAKPPGYGPPPAQPGWGPPTTPAAPPPVGDAGWGAPPQGSAGWGAPQQQWGGGPAQTETKAVIALVLAISAYVFLPFVAAIAGLVLARMAKRDIAASGGRLSGTGLATAAFWLSVVHLVFVALLFLGLFLLVVGGFAFS